MRQVLEQVQLFDDQVFFEYRTDGVVCNGGDSRDARFSNQFVGDSLRLVGWWTVRDVNGNILKRKNNNTELKCELDEAGKTL